MKALKNMGQNLKSDSQSTEEVHTASDTSYSREFGNIICTCPRCWTSVQVSCFNCHQSNDLELASNEQGDCAQCSCGGDTGAILCGCGCDILGSFFEYVDVEKLFKKVRSLRTDYVSKKLSKKEKKHMKKC